MPKLLNSNMTTPAFVIILTVVFIIGVLYYYGFIFTERGRNPFISTQAKVNNIKTAILNNRSGIASVLPVGKTIVTINHKIIHDIIKDHYTDLTFNKYGRYYDYYGQEIVFKLIPKNSGVFNHSSCVIYEKGSALCVYSIGVNGVDENGFGDDVVPVSPNR
jgi:hypothetical protein